MDKELYITQWFSEEMRAAGGRLVKRLQESSAEVALAYWVLDSEEKVWELIIISPLVGIEGARAYYKRIDDINCQAGPDEETLSLHDINVSSLKHPIVKALKNSLIYQADLDNRRLGRNWIGGFFVEDSYFYHVNWNMLQEADVQVTG